jgi:hypothetical protein
VFNLSSWAERRRPLKDWLVAELNQRYDVPAKVAQAWMDADAVLPLLDGLDEVAAEHRSDCAEAINTYRHHHGLVPLAVCSRLADYEALTNRLRLQGAVVVGVLTPQQVDAYFEHVGTTMAGMRAAVCDDAELGDLLDTPLMLSIVVLAYKDKSLKELKGQRTSDQRRQHLFNAYIEAMFGRRRKETRYTQVQTRRWLEWLAHTMVRQSQSLFFIERLQPQWLPSSAARLQYTLLDRAGGALLLGLVLALVAGLVASFGDIVIGLIVGLATMFFGGQSSIDELQQRGMLRRVADSMRGSLIGALIGALIGSLLGGPGYALAGGMFFGLISGLLGLLTGKPGVGPRALIVVERLRWVWSKAWRSAMSGLAVGFVFGMVVGQLITLSTEDAGLAYRLVFGLLFGLAFGLAFGLVSGLIGGLHSDLISATTRPNQGIKRSAFSALAGGVIGGVIGGLVMAVGAGLAEGPDLALVGVKFGGPVVGMVVGLSFGGYVCLSHLALRLVLSHNGSLPLRLVPFLDYCAERIFLRKVGGGYIFVHRLLMEHFASLHEAPPTEGTG